MNKEIIIETDRLILRAFEESDLDEYAKMMGNKNVYQWLGNRKERSREDAKKLIHYFIGEFKENGIGVLAVISKESGKLIGQAGVNYQRELDAREYLYALDYNEWNKGYATEIGKHFIEYYRSTFPKDKLIAIVHPDNLQSKKILSRLGFEYKGQKELFDSILDYYELR